VVLGLLLTLIPSVIIKAEKADVRFISFYEGQEEFKGAYGPYTPKYSIADFEVLGFSFMIALIAYAWLKWKIPH